ncbi:MAG: helix-turn-helix domain-containing protein [Tannerellaceae bacterium]|nr:helix-turn-helix domain-containing protein [Tannerellaceae bacterium]
MYEFQLTEKNPYQAEIILLEKEKKREIRNQHPTIIFATGASLKIIFSFNKEKIIEDGQFFLLPQHFPCLLIPEKEQEVLLLTIPNITSLYIRFFSTWPIREIDNFKDLFFPLTAGKPVLHLIDNIKVYITEGRATNLLMGLKAFELFHLLNHCYTREFIYKFFSPIMTDDYSFALFVLTNHSKVKTAEGLARLSNYTISGFEKQFRRVFGVAPYRWMLQKKIEKVYYEIYETSKPIKIIAEEMGFANLSNFGDFCRKHFGLSPALIRKKRLE